MLTPHFADLVHHHFDDIHDAAAFFHVQPITVQRWLSGEVPMNPMAEKLMNIHARGYLPLDHRWNGFKVHFDRATLITPERREFNPKELLSFAYWRDEHRQLVERHGRIDSPKFYPPKEHPLPFRGGRRMPAKPWVPTKFK
ncbi:S-adenosylhomocysteine hydrolase [Vibrio crassostreae]|uniref:phage protein n=2 Tax=Vibrio crassostreae TaxID=246167 RepID=UPI00148C4D15|nr:phage protein [Vibrio crassostreae]NOH76075.1 S-adenosylhomocysteine hydrolase [Vibrio crassostreae]CAK2474438.1 S-adenosylhomocysteine hydrolase [Vibrio crassostreae]CAK2782978.1 S-adenosylhomocysteine hydrolase [Vibrio crassostreae]CAK3392340.1 S-adenosylhomocysteine hydrolase [Vibrio crassostreae]